MGVLKEILVKYEGKLSSYFALKLVQTFPYYSNLDTRN